MIVLVIFSTVILFSLTLNVIQKIRSYNNASNRSLWQDGDSVVVKPKDEAESGFNKRITTIK